MIESKFSNKRKSFGYPIGLLNLFFCFSIIGSSFAQTGQDTVDIVHFDQAKHGLVLKEGEKSIFWGEVEFSHKGVFFYADSVIKTKNTVKAYGNILIQQGDTLNIFADSLHYDSDLTQCILYGNVSFLKGDQRLYTEKLSYNTKTKLAKYEEGGVLTNGDTWVKSNSCDYNATTEEALLNGNVYVENTDLKIKARRLHYNLKQRIVKFLSPTLLAQSNGTQLYCEGGYYDIGKEKGRFIGSPQYQKEKTKAKAAEMNYDGLTGVYSMNGNAIYLDSLRYIKGQKIKYTEPYDFYEIYGDAYYQDSEYRFAGPAIKFDKKNNNVITEGRSRIINEDFTLEADKTNFDNSSGLGTTSGNVIWQSNKDNTTIWAEDAKTDKENGSIKAYGNRAMVSLVNDQDTLFLSADTLFSFQIKKKLSMTSDTLSLDTLKADSVDVMRNRKDQIQHKKTKKVTKVKVEKTEKNSSTQPRKTEKDFVAPSDTTIQRFDPLILPDSMANSEKKDSLADSTRILMAFHKVKLFSKKFQGVSDSLYYSSQDSIFKMYRNPVLWSDTTSQYKSDTIFIALRDNKLHYIKMDQHASIFSTKDEKYFNQITGEQIVSYFVAGKLYSLTVDGTARTVLYDQDADSTYRGVNTLNCARLKVWFIDSKIDKVRFYKKNDGIYYPMSKANHAEIQLKGFTWKINDRPKNLNDLRDNGANVLPLTSEPKEN